MCVRSLVLVLILTLFQSIIGSRIEIDIPSISPSHIFELSSNTSQFLHRDVLFGLVDGASGAIPSAIQIRGSYEQLQIEQLFNLYEPSNKQEQKQEQINKEPIFRSYLLTPTFNRSHPFIRVLIASALGSHEKNSTLSMCAIVTAVNDQNLYETQACVVSPSTGYCLATLPVLKMVEYSTKNQTSNKIELYLKVRSMKASLA